MKKLFLLLVLLTIKTKANNPDQYYIIIHGTWAQPFTWHMPGGDFYDALARANPPGAVLFFLWPGKNNHQTRVDAAHDLVQFIQNNFKPNESINLVTHSHGANVGIIASQILAKNNSDYRIHCFYALGAPVHRKEYQPNMNSIHYLYHFFSFQDFVQPVFGLFERQHPEHERIANINVHINGKQPSHSELHHPLIAKWIPHLHTQLQEKKLGNFENFDFKQSCIIHFADNDIPRYEIDCKRNEMLHLDRMNLFMMNNLLRRRKAFISSLP